MAGEYTSKNYANVSDAGLKNNDEAALKQRQAYLDDRFDSYFNYPFEITDDFPGCGLALHKKQGIPIADDYKSYKYSQYVITSEAIYYYSKSQKTIVKLDVSEKDFEKLNTEYFNRHFNIDRLTTEQLNDISDKLKHKAPKEDNVYLVKNKVYCKYRKSENNSFSIRVVNIDSFSFNIEDELNLLTCDPMGFSTKHYIHKENATVITIGGNYYSHGLLADNTWGYTLLDSNAIIKNKYGLDSNEMKQHILSKHGHCPEKYEFEILFNEKIVPNGFYPYYLYSTELKKDLNITEITPTNLTSGKDVILAKMLVIDSKDLGAQFLYHRVNALSVKLKSKENSDTPRLDSERLLESLLPEMRTLMGELHAVYQDAKSQGKKQTIFELEQIVGRLEDILIDLRKPVVYEFSYEVEEPKVLKPGIVYVFYKNGERVFQIDGMKVAQRFCFTGSRFATNLCQNDKDNIVDSIKDQMNVMCCTHDDFDQEMKTYHAAIEQYHQNLDELTKLAQRVSLNASPTWQNISRSLMVIGAVVLVGFVLAATIPVFSTAFATALGSVGLLGASTLLAQMIGLTNAVAGGALVGGVVGLGIGSVGFGLGLNSYDPSKKSLVTFATKAKEKASELLTAHDGFNKVKTAAPKDKVPSWGDGFMNFFSSNGSNNKDKTSAETQNSPQMV